MDYKEDEIDDPSYDEEESAESEIVYEYDKIEPDEIVALEKKTL
jgi:hypothetical protein